MYMSPYISTDKAAAITGKHPETIRRWCRKGKLKHKKIGHEFLILETQFEVKDTKEEADQAIRSFVFS